MKTDRRNAVKLARRHRAGELTGVWVPGEEHEAMRDLTRAREDLKGLEFKARQRLRAFLLRRGRVYRVGKSRWTQQHFRWLGEQRFEHPVQQVLFQECVDTVMEARRRVAGLEAQMRQALQGWSLRPVVEARLTSTTLPANQHRFRSVTHSPASLPLFWCRFTWGDARVRFRRSVANHFLVVRRLTALSSLAMPASFALSSVAGRAAEG